MSTTTVFGPVADAIGAITHTEPVQGPYGVWQRRSYDAAPAGAYRRVQVRVPVHVDHEGRELGKLEHLELLRDGQLVAVATLDLDSDLGAGWYWSPTIVVRGNGVVDVSELSLTKTPASISLRAVRALPGNVRFQRDRDSWDLPGSVKRMMEAAAAGDRDRPILVRTSTTPQLTRAHDPETDQRILDALTDTSTAGRSRRGRIWYSRPVPGSIISVR